MPKEMFLSHLKSDRGLKKDPPGNWYHHAIIATGIWALGLPHAAALPEHKDTPSFSMQVLTCGRVCGGTQEAAS